MDDPLTGSTIPGARGMAVSLLQYANREAVAQALTERGYSVSRATVNRWARGQEMPTIAARMIGELFAHTEEAPEPVWVQGLRAELVAEIRKNREAIAQQADGLVTAELRQMMNDYLSEIERPQPQPGVDPAGSVNTPRAGSGGRRQAKR